MCPRIKWVKVRPGDLVWCLMKDGIEIYYDIEAGANDEAKDVAGYVCHKVPCLLLALIDDTMMVLLPSGKFGWTYRLLWEKAYEEKQVWEYMDDGEVTDA